MANAYNTIWLKGTGRIEEAFAAGTITPGQLIKIDSADKVLRHATAGGRAEAAFAIEDSLQGHTIDDNYSADDLVFYKIAKKGDVVFAFIDAGENIAAGAILQSAGNGNLEAVAGSNTGLAVAEDAINLSSSSAVATRIPVRII